VQIIPSNEAFLHARGFSRLPQGLNSIDASVSTLVDEDRMRKTGRKEANKNRKNKHSHFM